MMAQSAESGWLRAGMNVRVSEVGVTVPLQRTLLQHVSLSVQAGEMVALMGPSGAGKTTLLNCLVGRCVGSVEGNITYNGKSFKQMRQAIGYVTQEDIMYETLTPRENLTFAARLMLSRLSARDQTSAVEEVICKLNLQKCANTPVGSPGLVRGISGGERKRTNVALSLLGRPGLLLLDEPTSGLDSKMSDSLVRDIKEVAREGCTAIATIHQPSEAVFSRFDKVLLLLSGRLAYFGPIAGLRGSLSDLGFKCTDGVPLPELLLDALEPPQSAEEQQEHRTKLHQLRRLTDGTPSTVEVPQLETEASNLLKPSRAGLAQQLRTLLHRELMNLKRCKVLTIVRAAQSVGASVLVGLIFVQLEHNLSGIQTRLFSSFLLVFTQFMFAMLGVVNAFPAERAVFLRESQDGLYRPAAFFLAKAILDTLMQCLFPLLVVGISYPMVGLNAETLDRVLIFYTIMCIVSNCGSAVGFMVSAAVPTVSLALSIAPGLVMPQMLLSGIFIKVPGIHEVSLYHANIMVKQVCTLSVVVCLLLR